MRVRIVLAVVVHERTRWEGVGMHAKQLSGLLLVYAACGGSEHSELTATPMPSTMVAPSEPHGGYTTTTLALPDAGADGVGMDYLAFDPRTNSVWVPAGNTGSVDVVDVANSSIARVDGFPTQEMERRGRKHVVGPSSVTLGVRGTVYVGNRGDFTVCAIDEMTPTKGTCGKLDSMPDGIAYVEKTQEVWVTTPRDKSIRILDAATLVEKAHLTFEGEPEGFAPDSARGRFYTNLEDKDVTLAIDLATHETVATWKPNCGEEGPHGLRLAAADGVLLVACSTRVESIDVAHDGAVLGSLDTGDGVDDIDYSESRRMVYVGAAKAATLTIASLSTKGELAMVASVPTRDGARNGVVTNDGRVYLANSRAGQLIVVTPAATR
jgi:DNA-binding beta-propeller fold protein YncE